MKVSDGIVSFFPLLSSNVYDSDITARIHFRLCLLHLFNFYPHKYKYTQDVVVVLKLDTTEIFLECSQQETSPCYRISTNNPFKWCTNAHDQYEICLNFTFHFKKIAECECHLVYS